MAVARKGILGFGPAPDKDTAPTTFYRHRALEVAVGEVDQVQMFQPEVGGKPVPDGGYSIGPIIDGTFTLQPRLKGTFGWILAALTGSWTSTALLDASSNPDGSYQHDFEFGGVQDLPWLGLRVFTPGEGTGNDIGRTLIGNRVLAMRLIINTDAPPTATFAVRGRKWVHEDPSTWVWANNFEGTDTVPQAIQSANYMKVPGFSADPLPVARAEINVASTPADMRLDRVLGSPYLDNITITDQVLTIDAVLRWRDPTLYKAILNGSSTATSWSGTPFETDFDMLVEAPAVIPSTAGVTDRKYSLRFTASRVLWMVNGQITLGGNGVVMLPLRGVALDSTPYATISLVNDQAGYVW